MTHVARSDDGAEGPLLERARAGDREALETLLERHQGQVYRFGLRMCRDQEDARDVVQDTLFAMARGVRDFRGASSISTWLFTIARSFCIKKRRKGRYAPKVERSLDTDVAPEAAQIKDPARGPDDVVAARQVQQALEEAIGALSPSHREVLLLRDAEGLTAPEVAEVLGITPQAVKSRLHRARLDVRARMAPLLGIGDPAPAAPGTCPDVLALYSRHLEGQISNDVCAAMERHLQTCTRCGEACESLKRTVSLCRAASPDEVPQAIQDSIRSGLRALLDEKA